MSAMFSATTHPQKNTKIFSFWKCAITNKKNHVNMMC